MREITTQDRGRRRHKYTPGQTREQTTGGDPAERDLTNETRGHKTEHDAHQTEDYQSKPGITKTETKSHNLTRELGGKKIQGDETDQGDNGRRQRGGHGNS